MRVTKRKRKTPLGKSKNSTYVARIRKSQNNTNTKNTNDKRLFDHHAHRVVVDDRSSSSSSSNSSNGTGSIHCARARAFWSSQTKSLNFLKCLVLVSIFENLQKYDLLFSLFLGRGVFFLYLSSSFMSAKGKAEESSPKKRETPASFSRRMVVHERCANKACGAFVSVFFFFACISFSLVFVFWILE